MLNQERTEIALLHPVIINYHLDKWRDESNKSKLSGIMSSDMDETVSTWTSSNPNTGYDGIPFEIRRDINSPIQRAFVKVYISLRKLITPSISEEEFFQSVKNSFSDLGDKSFNDKSIDDIVEKIKKYQKFASLKIENESIVSSYEKKLKEAGITKYQTEQSLISFIKKSKKGLQLKLIESFSYEIPHDVIDKINKADSLKVFDNYLILYYDKGLKQNIFYEKPKDPIVFGVLRGSTNLYFIADWVSDFCDLTYDKLVSVGGSDYNL